MADNVYSIQEITTLLQDLLEQALSPVWVEGEVSNFRASQAGHWYFTLKDDRAQLPCVMWRNMTIRHEHLRPEDGALLRVYGTVTIYPQGGTYQIRATRLLPVGQGALQIAFERLRDRLLEEGLFAQERKRPIPRFPRRIGVVTSAQGAALHDVLQILRRRFPCVQVTVCPTLVQGDEAPSQIVRALDVMNRIGSPDVLIVGRGGGSMEDLWAFNDERVVRAVVASSIPIVSAVGHEIDFTLTDFAADERAPTPSAAAEIVVPDRDSLTADLRDRQARLSEAIRTRLRLAHQHVRRLEGALAPERQQERLRHREQYVDDLARRMVVGARAMMERRRSRVETAVAAIHALSPLATLGRGYGICYGADGSVLRNADAANVGDTVRVRLHRGELHGVVTDRTNTDDGTGGT